MMAPREPIGTGDTAAFREAHPFRKRLYVAIAAIGIGVVVAGFWNYQLVDGFGQTAFAEPLVGDTSAAAGTFESMGFSFGILFAVAAGLAATFTACNCVVFAMMPELACSSDTGVDRRGLLWSLGAFTSGVVGVGIAYGMFVGMLGPDGIEAMNARSVRFAQAQAVFSLLGSGLLVWGAGEMGFLDGIVRRLSPATRAFLGQPTTRAAVMGLFVGLFAVGRPFPVFRELLTYAATAESPIYGAVVMVVNDLAMIAAMVLLLVMLVYLLGDRLTSWVQDRPHGPRVVSGFALLAGGAYFVFYWGLSFAFDIGQWGFKLGWYG